MASNKQRSGFTLVELLTAVSIVGILASIAVPSYVKYQRQARQSEAKVSLGALYMAENTMMQDQHSYSGCFSGITGGPPSGIDYYSVGFGTGIVSGNTSCAPFGGGSPSNMDTGSDLPSGVPSANCLVFGWANIPNNGSVATCTAVVTNPNAYCFTPTQYCAAQGNGFTYYKGKEVSSPDDQTALSGTTLTWSSFTVTAAAQLGGAVLDKWQIDQDKVVSLNQSGL